MKTLMKTWTKCFGGWKEAVNHLFFKNSGLIKVTSATFGLGWKSSCKVDESWRHTLTHIYSRKSTISHFSMKLYHVPISQLRQWRHALFWILGPFQGCRTDPGIVWHVYWFSLLCLLENIVQQRTFVISKHSEKCCLTTEQILLDCFGLRIATLLKLSQSSIQEARYFVWMEHKSELDLGAACAPYSEALSSLGIPLPNLCFQTSGAWFHRSACSKLTLPIAFILWLLGLFQERNSKS